MAAIKGKNTKPEIIVRKALHAAGFRFRLHDKKLPGKPDIVLPKYRAVVLVHGCFWHGHECKQFRWPRTREAFWRKKIHGNQERDVMAITQLKSSGWRSLIVWECSLRGAGKLTQSDLAERCATWLKSEKPRGAVRGRK